MSSDLNVGGLDLVGDFGANDSRLSKSNVRVLRPNNADLHLNKTDLSTKHDKLNADS